MSTYSNLFVDSFFAGDFFDSQDDQQFIDFEKFHYDSPPASLTPIKSEPMMDVEFKIDDAIFALKACEEDNSQPSKKQRKVKVCSIDGCNRRAQSMNRCKSHGGGARCQYNDCTKSSQGGGFCRSHGGGKKCTVEGCKKGTQRAGLCYQHGGIRRCTKDGCDKKDRGNGFCIGHGGGRRCELVGCERTVRKGRRCRTHMDKKETKAFIHR